jgi:hypothetical protein
LNMMRFSFTRVTSQIFTYEIEKLMVKGFSSECYCCYLCSKSISFRQLHIYLYFQDDNNVFHSSRSVRDLKVTHSLGFRSHSTQLRRVRNLISCNIIPFVHSFSFFACDKKDLLAWHFLPRVSSSLRCYCREGLGSVS